MPINNHGQLPTDLVKNILSYLELNCHTCQHNIYSYTSVKKKNTIKIGKLVFCDMDCYLHN